jgi:hypothetical protein
MTDSYTNESIAKGIASKRTKQLGNRWDCVELENGRWAVQQAEEPPVFQEQPAPADATEPGEEPKFTDGDQPSLQPEQTPELQDAGVLPAIIEQRKEREAAGQVETPAPTPAPATDQVTVTLLGARMTRQYCVAPKPDGSGIGWYEIARCASASVTDGVATMVMTRKQARCWKLS